MGSLKRKPGWIKFTIPGGSAYTTLKKHLSEHKLNTVCVEARCPNIGECFSCGTATFLLLGDTCTRNCKYCSIENGTPQAPDPEEPGKIAAVIKKMGLRYAVLTSVTRDDLPGEGAEHFAKTIYEIKQLNPGCGIEVLVPDFRKNHKESIDIIAREKPDVFNHNIEVVKNYFEHLRPRGDYRHSLRVLEYAVQAGLTAKSGLMIGFGETMKDIFGTLMDLHKTGCGIVTIGQYLQSSKNGYQVEKYYTPEEFDILNQQAQSIGFKKVYAGPNIRSSYHAEDIYNRRSCHASNTT